MMRGSGSLTMESSVNLGVPNGEPSYFYVHMDAQEGEGDMVCLISE